jgi:flagellar motor switch protein FliM
MSGDITFDLAADLVSLFKATVPSNKAVDACSVSSWQDQILARLEPAEIELMALLADVPLSLDVISKLKIGQVVSLGVNFKSPIAVHAGETKLYSTRLGQNDGNFCLVVESREKIQSAK